MSSDKYLKQIQKAAGAAPPVPDASQVFQTTPPPIPRKKDRGYRFSNDGLIIQRQLTREEFREGLLPEIEAMQSRYQLIVGDAANHGLDNGLIDSYEDMAALTGYTAGSIEVYASICRNIPQLTRVNSLKFKHYQVIARLSEEERPHWISFAATYGLGYRVIESMIADIDARLPALLSGNDTAIVPAEVEPTALSDEIEGVQEEEVESFAVPVDAPENRERMNYVWKKVTRKTLTVQDLPEVIFMRQWCDRVIKDFNRRK